MKKKRKIRLTKEKAPHSSRKKRKEQRISGSRKRSVKKWKQKLKRQDKVKSGNADEKGRRTVISF